MRSGPIARAVGCVLLAAALEVAVRSLVPVPVMLRPLDAAAGLGAYTLAALPAIVLGLWGGRSRFLRRTATVAAGAPVALLLANLVFCYSGTTLHHLAAVGVLGLVAGALVSH